MYLVINSDKTTESTIDTNITMYVNTFIKSPSLSTIIPQERVRAKQGSVRGFGVWWEIGNPYTRKVKGIVLPFYYTSVLSCLKIYIKEVLI